MYRRTRIFIAFAVGFAIIICAITMPDFDAQLRTFYAAILWGFYCMWVGRFIKKWQTGTDE